MNNPQLLAYLINAQTSVNILGRATGKTSRITALWLLDKIERMPRSIGGLIVPNEKNQEKILGEIWNCWEEFGYVEGVDYVVGKRPPKEFKQAYKAPKDNFHNYISFKNGSGLYILSSRTKHNGSNLDYLGVEEARFCDELLFNETLYAMRSNSKHFGHLACHKAVLLVTDMPDGDFPQQAWVLQYKEKMNLEFVAAILCQQIILDTLRKELDRLPTPKAAKRIKKEKEIAEAAALLEFLRKGVVFYQEADSLENIAALGVDVINQWLTGSTNLDDFLRAVLNVQKVSDSKLYYAAFKKSVHTYYAPDRQLPIVHTEKDSRFDADVVPDEALHIAFDYNNSFCPVVVGQVEEATTLRIVNNLYVYHPQDLKDLIKQFCHYYRYHKEKTVYYYYDHTALQGRSATSAHEHCFEVERQFTALDWHIVPIYIGQACSHDTRIAIWKTVLQEQDVLELKLRINQRCEKFITAIEQTKIKQVESKGKKYRTKDKGAETSKRKSLDHATLTHQTEALDMLLMGVREEHLRYYQSPLGNIT